MRARYRDAVHVALAHAGDLHDLAPEDVVSREAVTVGAGRYGVADRDPTVVRVGRGRSGDRWTPEQRAVQERRRTMFAGTLWLTIHRQS